MQLFISSPVARAWAIQKLDGRLESLSFADFALKINQTRHGVDAGGKMSSSAPARPDQDRPHAAC